MYLPLRTCLRATRVRRGVDCLHVKCLPARRFCKTAAQCAQHEPPQAKFGEIEDKFVNGTRAVAFVAVLSFTLAPGKAQAWGHDWKPRRHYRRMTDSRAAFDLKTVFQTDKVKEKLGTGSQQLQQQAGNAFSEMSHLARDVQHSLHKVVNHAPRQREMHMSQSARPTGPSAAGRGQGVAGPLGWVAFAVAAVGLIWLLFSKTLSGWVAGWGKGGRQGGKWVSDRSLGGRMVWMPDEPKTTSSSARSQSMRWNDTPSSLPSSTSSSAAAVLAPDNTQSASTSGRQAGSGAGTQQGPPSWWDPPPTIHVDKRYKDQTSSQARTILRQLEDAKLLSGQDYSTSALVSLRQTCADSGATVKAQTPSGGDAIFRAGVEAAASAAMEAGEGASLGGTSPQRFVSGLAQDLGLADERAGSMAVAVVSARLRSALIDAAAAYRQGKELDVLNELVRIVGALDKFPLQPRSPQADMIATAVQQRATLPERQALFFTYGGMEPSTASLVAEMLGFNPDFVMPQLHHELTTAQQADVNRP
ncbi:TPA: hypothetical protein ACH3X1_005685 [Trebouxia sp. C0004]